MRTAKTGREAVTEWISVYSGILEDQEKHGRLKKGHKMLTETQYIFIMTYGRLDDMKTVMAGRRILVVYYPEGCVYIYSFGRIFYLKRFTAETSHTM